MGPNIDVDKLVSAPPPAEESEPITPAIPVPDEKLQQLFNKQRDQGGIIDLSDNCTRLLVISSPTVPALPIQRITMTPEQRSYNVVHYGPSSVHSKPGRLGGGYNGYGRGHGHGNSQRHYGHARTFHTAAEEGHGPPRTSPHVGSSGGLHKESRGTGKPHSAQQHVNIHVASLGRPLDGPVVGEPYGKGNHHPHHPRRRQK